MCMTEVRRNPATSGPLPYQRHQMFCCCSSDSTSKRANAKVHPLKQGKLGGPAGFTNNPVPMELYHMEASPPCRAVRMVARHLNLSLNLIPVNFMAGEHMTPQFRKINPQSVLPTLVDDGFVLWESRAVQTYLVNRYVPHSPLYPEEARSRATVERLLYFDMGTLFDACHTVLYPVIFGGPPPDSEQEKPLVRALDLLVGFLGDNRFVTGDDVTLADISILASLTVTECSDYDLSRFPTVMDYYERLKSTLPYFSDINDLGIQQMRGIRKQGNSK